MEIKEIKNTVRECRWFKKSYLFYVYKLAILLYDNSNMIYSNMIYRDSYLIRMNKSSVSMCRYE